MTKFTVNQNKVFYKDVLGMDAIDFHFLNEKVYSAYQIQRIVGTYLSDVIWADNSFLRWNEAQWESELPEGTDAHVYFRSADTVVELQSASWSGPYLNSLNDISTLTGRFLQFLVMLILDRTTDWFSSSSSSSSSSTSSSSSSSFIFSSSSSSIDSSSSSLSSSSSIDSSSSSSGDSSSSSSADSSSSSSSGVEGVGYWYIEVDFVVS